MVIASGLALSKKIVKKSNLLIFRLYATQSRVFALHALKISNAKKLSLARIYNANIHSMKQAIRRSVESVTRILIALLELREYAIEKRKP